MNIQQLCTWLDHQAPFETAESFDNVGLLIGCGTDEITGILFGLDITDTMLEEALRLGVNTLVTHHPFLFHAVKRIDTDSPQGRRLAVILSHRLNVLAVHTDWDKAPGGISDELAQVLGLKNVTAADPYLRVGTLPEPLEREAFCRFVNDRLKTDCRLYGEAAGLVSRVAVGGGAYGEAAFFARSFGAEALVTGEIRHHELIDGTAQGLLLCEAGHYATEFPGLTALYRRFRQNALMPADRVFLHSSLPFRGALRLPEGGSYGTD